MNGEAGPAAGLHETGRAGRVFRLARDLIRSPAMNPKQPAPVSLSLRLVVGAVVCALTIAIGLPLALLVVGCGGGGPPSGSGGAGGGSNAGDTCHPMADLSCSPDAASKAALCAQFFGAANPDPIVCEGVTPDGNCCPLDEFTSDDTSSCEGGSIAGMVWCCGANSSASCLPFDDAACDGTSAADLVGRCEEAFGDGYSAVFTCAPGDGPATCKNLSRHKGGRPVCDGVERVLWCCTSDGLPPAP